MCIDLLLSVFDGFTTVVVHKLFTLAFMSFEIYMVPTTEDFI